MRVLVVQNYDNTGLGQIGAALEEAGAELDIRNAHLGDMLPPDADGHDAISDKNAPPPKSRVDGVVARWRVHRQTPRRRPLSPPWLSDQLAHRKPKSNPDSADIPEAQPR